MAQLYVGYPESAGDSPLQLRGYRDPVLEPGAAVQLEARLSPRDRRRWDSINDQWVVTPGEYVIAVGASSSDLRQQTTVVLAR